MQPFVDAEMLVSPQKSGLEMPPERIGGFLGFLLVFATKNGLKPRRSS